MRPLPAPLPNWLPRSPPAAPPARLPMMLPFEVLSGPPPQPCAAAGTAAQTVRSASAATVRRRGVVEDRIWGVMVTSCLVVIASALRQHRLRPSEPSTDELMNIEEGQLAVPPGGKPIYCRALSKRQHSRFDFVPGFHPSLLPLP